MAAGALASFFSNPATIKAIGEIGVGIFSANQAKNSRKRAESFLEDIKEIQDNRQDITNVYSSLSNPYSNIENPYKNLAVATQAANMQAEQADIALANTLDTLRETGKGAGGATALAQAALRSKKDISASIEQQEINNEKLKAQGQLNVDLAKAKGQLQIDTLKGKGEAARSQMQESRDLENIDRLQYSADSAARTQQNQLKNAISGLIGGASGLTSSGMKAFMGDGTGVNKGKKSTPYDLGVNDNNSNLTDNDDLFNKIESNLPELGGI